MIGMNQFENHFALLEVSKSVFVDLILYSILILISSVFVKKTYEYAEM